MARYTVSVAVRAWLDKEVEAKTEEEARSKVLAQVKHQLNSGNFSWIDGRAEVMGSTNSSLMNKIPR
jgi:hypothetical protein